MPVRHQTQTPLPLPPTLLREWSRLEQRYTELAREFNGTDCELAMMLRGYVRQWARSIVRSDPDVDQRLLANAFAEMADRCQSQARAQDWPTAHALDLSNLLRNSVLQLGKAADSSGGPASRA